MFKLLKERNFWLIATFLGLDLLFYYWFKNGIPASPANDVSRYDIKVFLNTGNSFVLILIVAYSAWVYKLKGGLVTAGTIGILLLPDLIGTLAETRSLGQLSLYCFGAVTGPVVSWFVSNHHKSLNEIKGLLSKEREHAEQWQGTFDAFTESVCVISKEHKFLMVNKAVCQALGKTREEIVGRKCYELVHNTTEPIPECPCVETMKTGKAAANDLPVPGGGIYSLVAYPIFGEDGTVTAFTHLVSDVTEKKQMQEQLMIQDRLASVGQLVSGVAHEINNPLTSVLGFSQLALTRDLPPEVMSDLTTINQEAKRIAVIVRQLLTFVRKQPEEKSSVQVNDVIRQVLLLRSNEHSINNIQTNTSLSPDLPLIHGNASQLQQVVFNLVINAEQAMLDAHKQGSLNITTRQAGNLVKICLADTGPGIVPENMPKLFTPFFTTKGIGKGTGLGLSICHGIITEHAGKIYAESEPGKGAVFIIELPVVKR